MKNKRNAIAALRAKIDDLYGELEEIAGDEEQESPPAYSIEFEFLDNLVQAFFYEITENEKVELARGHGHIIHRGALGIAQAASYALKRIYHDLEEEEN